MQWGVVFDTTRNSSSLHTKLLLLLPEILDLWLIIAVEVLGGASKCIFCIISLGRSNRPPQFFSIRWADVLRRYELGEASVRHPLVLAVWAADYCGPLPVAHLQSSFLLSAIVITNVTWSQRCIPNSCSA